MIARALATIVFLFAWVSAPLFGKELTIQHLRCEYRVNPVGLDVQRPRLSWVLASDVRGAQQTGYRILVASSPERLRHDEGDLWDSGKVDSDASAQVEYQGRALTSRMQCHWKLAVWGKDGKRSSWSPQAVWTMGLLEASDWTARWIEAPTSQLTFTPAHNGYHSEFAGEPNTEKWVSIDLGKAKQFDAVRLYPAHPQDWQPDTLGFMFPVRFRVDVSDVPDFGSFKTVVAKTGLDVENPGAAPVEYSFPSTEARYVRLFVTRLGRRDGTNFGFALAEMQVLASHENLALNAPVAALDSTESGAWSKQRLVDGVLVARNETVGARLPAPLFRKEFRPEARVKRATAYVSALGLYEVRLNGDRVGDHLLAPEWTDYRQRVQYQTYDVTAMVRSGDNALTAELGEGWYAGRLGLAPPPGRGIYGWNPRLLVQMDLEFADGRRQRIASDGSWRCYTNGPIITNDLLEGETYDARKEVVGWTGAEFNDSAWLPVQVAQNLNARLVSQPNEPIRAISELKPVALTEPKRGVFIFDLGQNMVGWCRFKAQASPGTTVTLRHGEALNPDGTLYTANLRGAFQVDRYTYRSSAPEVFEPHFTYHGFRYVEVTGLSAKPTDAALSGRVFNSSSPEVSRFECSSPMLNRLMQNILWTQRANLMSVPTDCPQRDERAGWMGDIQVFSQTACFNMDMAGFFTKWVKDIRDAQDPEGRYADYSPRPFGGGGAPAWADAGVVVPWRMYQNYGDTRMLEEHFSSAKRWIEYVRSNNPDLIWRKGRNADYNDWLNADTLVLKDWPKTGAAVPPEVLATAFFAHSTELVGNMARAAGKQQDAATYSRLADDIKAAFNKAFVKPDATILGNTQAGYALALHFNLLPESIRAAAAGHMVEGVHAYKDHISTGIQSTIRLMLELTRNGYGDLAYQLINNRTMPSWGYSVDQGATTIWERWDGYVAGRGFQDPGMNSLNHWAIGSVGEWMWRVVVGINPDDARPGYQHFTIQPRPGGGLNWAKGEYNSIRGRIVSNWKLSQTSFALHVVIPPNTSATVYVPVNDAAAVMESRKPAWKATGVKSVRQFQDSVALELESGTYDFACPY